MYLPEQIINIIDTYKRNGFECFVVGGSVRDSLLCRKVSDYDLCTNALPEQTMSLFEHTVPTGLKHGTITILAEDMPIEVTTYRQESGYADHRHPDTVEFVSDLALDLARRDFTINAIAYAPDIGYIDPFDGRKDLEERTIRAVGDPDRRFQEDALRMVRAHRFAAQLGFDIEAETFEAIEANAPLIEHVAVERLFPEWLKILEADPYQVRKMLSLFRPWLPELTASAYCEQNSVYHDKDVLDHTLCAIASLPEYDDLCAFALLLHDLGKPYVLITGHDGRDHFKGHQEVSYEIAVRACRDLKLPNVYKHTVPDLVRYHDEIMVPTLDWLYKFAVGLGFDHEKMRRLFMVQYGDVMAHSKKGRQRLSVLKDMIRFYEEEIGKRPVSFKELALDGKEVGQIAGVHGEAIGALLKELLRHAFFHPEDNTKEKLTEYLEKKGK